MRGGEDQNIPVPDGGDSEFRRRGYAERDVGVAVPDRHRAALLQRQERIGHGVAVVAPWRINHADRAQVELPALAHWPRRYRMPHAWHQILWTTSQNVVDELVVSRTGATWHREPNTRGIANHKR